VPATGIHSVTLAVSQPSGGARLKDLAKAGLHIVFIHSPSRQHTPTLCCSRTGGSDCAAPTFRQVSGKPHDRTGHPDDSQSAGWKLILRWLWKGSMMSLAVLPKGRSQHHGLSMIGGFRLWRGGSVQADVLRASQRLLTFLAFCGDVANRAAVAGGMWPDATDSHAYSNLWGSRRRRDNRVFLGLKSTVCTHLSAVIPIHWRVWGANGTYRIYRRCCGFAG